MSLYGIPVVESDWMPTDKIYLFNGKIVVPSLAAGRRERQNANLCALRPARHRAALRRENAVHPRTHRRRS